MPRSSLPLLLALFLAGPAAGEPGDYRIDPVHTRVAFRVDHAGLSRALGTFSGATGELRFDPDDWSTAQLDVSLRLDSLDFGDADWREKVLDRTFLDAGREPVARFTSTRVEATGPGTGHVFGQLQLHGTTREIMLDVRMNALKRHPLTFRRTAGFSATGRIARADFGIDAWPNVVGAEVELLIEAEAILDRNASADPIPEPAPETGADDAGHPSP